MGRAGGTQQAQAGYRSPQNESVKKDGKSASSNPKLVAVKELKSLGPRLENVLLQLPEPTVFDFNRSLRRPVSAKIDMTGPLGHSLQNFEQQQLKADKDKKADREMQETLNKQTEKLKLDYQSAWSLPFKVISPSDDKSSEHTGRRDRKTTVAKKGKKLGKGKTTAFGGDDEVKS